MSVTRRPRGGTMRFSSLTEAMNCPILPRPSMHVSFVSPLPVPDTASDNNTNTSSGVSPQRVDNNDHDDVSTTTQRRGNHRVLFALGATCQGWRRRNEDRVVLHDVADDDDDDNGSDGIAVCVVDGHRGEMAADFVAERLPRALIPTLTPQLLSAAENITKSGCSKCENVGSGMLYQQPVQEELTRAVVRAFVDVDVALCTAQGGDGTFTAMPCAPPCEPTLCMHSPVMGDIQPAHAHAVIVSNDSIKSAPGGPPPLYCHPDDISERSLESYKRSGAFHFSPEDGTHSPALGRSSLCDAASSPLFRASGSGPLSLETVAHRGGGGGGAATEEAAPPTLARPMMLSQPTVSAGSPRNLVELLEVSGGDSMSVMPSMSGGASASEAPKVGREGSPSGSSSGAAALWLCILGDCITVANMGDCRAYLVEPGASSGGSIIITALTADHRPSEHLGERERLLRLFGISAFRPAKQLPTPHSTLSTFSSLAASPVSASLQEDDHPQQPSASQCKRVGGRLGVSRAFGDFDLKFSAVLPQQHPEEGEEESPAVDALGSCESILRRSALLIPSRHSDDEQLTHTDAVVAESTLLVSNVPEIRQYRWRKRKRREVHLPRGDGDGLYDMLLAGSDGLWELHSVRDISESIHEAVRPYFFSPRLVADKDGTAMPMHSRAWRASVEEALRSAMAAVLASAVAQQRPATNGSAPGSDNVTLAVVLLSRTE